jgi:hypothetical protein
MIAFALGAIVLAGLGLALALRRPEVMLLGLIAASSLDTMGRLASVGGFKLTVYQAFLGVTILITVWLVAKGKAKLVGTPIDLWLGLLVLAAAAALPGAMSPKAGIVAFVSLCSSLALVYLAAILAPTSSKTRTVLMGIVILGAVLGALAIAERLGVFSVQPMLSNPVDGVRARVTFDDPNVLGGVLAVAAVIGVPLALSARRMIASAGLWVCVALAMMGVVATLSRGALLGLLVGAVVVVVFTPIRARTRIALLGIGAGALTILLVFVLDPAWVAAKLTGIGDNRSALYRLYLVRSAARMFVDHPLGIGPGNWPIVITAYHDPLLPVSLLESHTTIVTVLIEDGPIGALALIAAVGVSAWKMGVAALKAPGDRAVVASALGGLSVLVVQSMTYSIETSKFLWLLVGVGLAAAAAAWLPDKETT